MTDYEHMVKCDGCKQWWHSKCMGSSKTQCASQEYWYCSPRCAQRHKDKAKAKKPKFAAEAMVRFVYEVL